MLDGFEGAVGVVEREGLDGGRKREIAGESEEVARVLARHVGDAAQLALAPEQAVVVEGGHLVEVNGVDGDDAALAQSGERADNDLASGREGDGAVELDGRLGVFVADPRGAERGGGLAVRFAAGDDVDLAIPRVKNANGERGGAAEAIEADALAALDARDAQAAEADDAGAEQRGGERWGRGRRGGDWRNRRGQRRTRRSRR